MKKLTFITVLIVFHLCFSLSIFAQEKENLRENFRQEVSDTTSAGNEGMFFTGGSNPNMGTLLLKTFGSFIAIIFLIFLVVYLMKKFYLGKKDPRVGSNQLKHIGSLFVAPKKTVNLVKVGKKVIVLGVTENNINCLTELSEEEFDEVEIEQPVQNGGSFANQLNVVLNRFMKKEKA